MLSRTSKLDGIPSWSLQAVDTCPGAVDGSGDLVPVCQGCYARSGNYRFPAVKRRREKNRADWKSPTWVLRMAAAISVHRFFRWFDSGDVYHPDLACKILEVVRATPWAKHWIPTRSHKLPRIAPTLRKINAEPNAIVRPSADHINEQDHPTGSIVVSAAAEAPETAFICRAYETDPARCNGCRACWNKDIPLIAYLAHGRAMTKVVLENSHNSKPSRVA